MKRLLLLLLMVLPVSHPMAQTKKHHVLFAVTSDDPTDLKLTLGNVKNTSEALPANSFDIEVVAWGAGIALIQKGSALEKELISLEGPHVHFVACAYSLAHRNLSKADILPGVDTVPIGVVEAITKQEDGWVYIKGGR